MDPTALIREFGLPIAVLVAFVTSIATGLFVPGKSLERERKVADDARIEERRLWTQRADDWKDRALSSEKRLGDALPALTSAVEALRMAREDLRVK